jgi:hypothetical protein
MDEESVRELSKWLSDQLKRFHLSGDVIKQYAINLLDHGWDNVDAIEEHLDDEYIKDYMDFMPIAQKLVLKNRLKEIRERRADGQEPTNTPGASPPRNEENSEPLHSAAATDYTFNEYIDLLKYDRDGEEALKTYNEWRESGRLRELAEKRLDEKMAQMDPESLAELSDRFPARQYGLDLAMMFLIPLAARPKPKGRLKRTSPDSSSDEDSDEFESNLRSAIHLANRVITGIFQGGKTEVIAFTIIIASAFMVPTVVITDKVSLSSDLKPKIQMIVRKLLGGTGTFADGNIFCITKKDDSLLNYNCMEEGFCPRCQNK